MKPPILYFGAKGRIADQIVGLMPEHAGYVEPFAGSLAVLLAKSPTKLEVVNDLDGALMTFWRVLRDRPAELIRAAANTPHSRAELEQSRDLADVDDLEQARRVWVALTQGRGASLRYPAGWRTFYDPAATNGSIGTYMNAYRDRLAPAAERIRNVSLECRDALDVIDDYGTAATNLLYVDPPYELTTRNPKLRYVHEFESEQDHRQLAEHLHACASVVMLSGYPSPLYDELYGDWYRHDVGSFTANATGAAQDRVEVVWCNRQLGGLLW